MTSTSRLHEFLAHHGRVGLDTSVFIYHLDAHPEYGQLVGPVFAWLEGPRASAVTSTITMVELLVHPYRKGDIDRVNLIYALTSTFPHLAWLVPTLEIADEAARLRARHNLRTPDAIQAATALVAGVGGFLANDAAFRRVTGLDVLLLNDLLNQ